jgi:hypothetical protein
MTNSTLLKAGTLFGALATLSLANPVNAMQLPRDPSPTVLVAQVSSQVAQGEKKPVPTTTVPPLPSSSAVTQPQPSSSAVTQEPTGVFTQRGDEAAADIFLESLKGLNDSLTQGSDKARKLQNLVPGD